MPSVCLDASLVVILLLPDERREFVRALWARWQAEGAILLGPPLLFAEVPSVLREAVFFGRLSQEEGEEAFETFCAMGIAVSRRPDLHRLAWELAKQHRRPRVYDSFYLAAAQAEGCDLWTGDRRLANAVRLPWVKSV
jgi:predicted nucleic acid-binding protein